MNNLNKLISDLGIEQVKGSEYWITMNLNGTNVQLDESSMQVGAIVFVRPTSDEGIALVKRLAKTFTFEYYSKPDKNGNELYRFIATSKVQRVLVPFEHIVSIYVSDMLMSIFIGLSHQ